MACFAFEHIGAWHYNLLILLIAALSSTIWLCNIAWQNAAYLHQVQYNLGNTDITSNQAIL
jgi:hypothetical protein